MDVGFDLTDMTPNKVSASWYWNRGTGQSMMCEITIAQRLNDRFRSVMNGRKAERLRKSSRVNDGSIQERQESWNIFGGVLDGEVAVGATRDEESLQFRFALSKAR